MPASTLAFFIFIDFMPLNPGDEFFMELSAHVMNAWKDKDGFKLDQLVADEFFFISNLNKTRTYNKQQWLQMVMQQYALKSYEIAFLEIRTYTHTAVVFYKLVMDCAPSMPGELLQYIVTDTWVYKEADWKIVCRQPVHI